MSLPGLGDLPIPVEARRRVARRSAQALGLFALGGAMVVVGLHRAGHAPIAFALLLGLAVGTALSASWLAGVLLCFHRSMSALQAATVSLWPVRVAGVIAALVYADVRGLEKGPVFVGLVVSHVAGQILQGWSTAVLADAARGAAARP